MISLSISTGSSRRPRRFAFVVARLQETQALYPQLEPTLGDLIWAPHTHDNLRTHRQFQGRGKIEALSLGNRTGVPRGDEHGAKAFKNAQMRILREIPGQPANGEGLELPAFVAAGPKFRSQLGLLASASGRKRKPACAIVAQRRAFLVCLVGFGLGSPSAPRQNLRKPVAQRKRHTLRARLIAKPRQS